MDHAHFYLPKSLFLNNDLRDHCVQRAFSDLSRRNGLREREQANPRYFLPWFKRDRFLCVIQAFQSNRPYIQDLLRPTGDFDFTLEAWRIEDLLGANKNFTARLNAEYIKIFLRCT